MSLGNRQEHINVERDDDIYIVEEHGVERSEESIRVGINFALECAILFVRKAEARNR